MTLGPSVTSLTVALARHSVTAAVSVSAVAGFCTVGSPVSHITHWNTNTEFRVKHITSHKYVSNTNFKIHFPTEILLLCLGNVLLLVCSCDRCFPLHTFPAVVSSPAQSAGAPPGHRVAVSAVLTHTPHLAALTEVSTWTRCTGGQRTVSELWCSGWLKLNHIFVLLKGKYMKICLRWFSG